MPFVVAIKLFYIADTMFASSRINLDILTLMNESLEDRLSLLLKLLKFLHGLRTSVLLIPPEMLYPVSLP